MYLPVFFKEFCIIFILTGCASRALTENENIGLGVEFENLVVLDEIDIYSTKASENSKEYLESRKSFESITDKSGLSRIRQAPFVIDNIIYYPSDLYEEDFYETMGQADLEWPSLVHEVCHVFYYQYGVPSMKHGNKPYHWRLGLWEQIAFEDPYKVPLPSEIDENDILTNYGFEQQCKIFEEWARNRNSDEFKPYGRLINNILKKYQVRVK